MNRSDYDRFAQTLTGVAELYGKSISAAAVSLWWDALKRFELADIERAFRAAISSPENGQFMPKPADLIRAIEGTSGDRSLLAWGKVMDAMRGAGAYNSVAFDDPVIHAAISDMGGWPKLCREDLEQLPFLQKRFCDLHKALSNGATPMIAYLPGEFELTNRLNGKPVAPPYLIGNPAAAARLLADNPSHQKTAIRELADAVGSAVRRLA